MITVRGRFEPVLTMTPTWRFTVPNHCDECREEARVFGRSEPIRVGAATFTGWTAYYCARCLDAIKELTA